MSIPAEARCPKCAAPRPPGAVECPGCGIIYARYRPARPPSPEPPPLPVPTATAPPPPPPPAGYVPARQMEALLVQLAQLLEAGHTVQQALSGEVLRPLPPAIASRLRAAAAADLPLSGILGPLKLLDGASLALLRAGERHGGLPRALRHLAARLAERRADRNRLLRTLTWPALLLLAAAVILPLPLLFTASPGAYLARVLPPLSAWIAAAVGLLAVLPRVSPDAPFRKVTRQLGLALPLTGTILRHGALATFAEVLGDCLEAGLPARESLELAARATPHPGFERNAGAMVRRLDGGSTLIGAMLESVALPADFMSQVATGEQSGKLGESLSRLAADYRDRARRAAKLALAALGMALFLAVSAIVATSIVHSYTSTLETREQTIEQILQE